MMIWNEWVGEVWDQLTAGNKLPVPTWLPHPAWEGFEQESIATPTGQSRDWVWGLDDESRIHVHEYEDGRLIAHRDKFDPNSNIGNALAHFFVETTPGKAILAFGLLVGLAKLARSAS